MSDLISRSELIKHFKAIQQQENVVGLEFVATIDEIKEQPTAYDVDKVVEELNKLDVKAIKRYKGGTFGDYEGTDYYIKKSEAIEIVKQGGDADGVCKWRCDAYGRWHTECHILADNDPLEYTYCPYCGKKIKVVG